MTRPRLGSLVLALALAQTSLACFADPYTKTRRLHYIGSDLVDSDPVPPLAYEAYLRARLALERSPQDLAGARVHIDEALRWDSREPQLWITRAEIAWLAGDLATADASLARALALQPGYPAAIDLQARISANTAELVQATP